VSKSRISLRTPSCKIPTSLTDDGCSAQAQVLNALTALTLLLCYLVRSFTAKGIYLKKGRSGLNLNRRSISVLEAVMSVTFSYLVRWPNKEYYNYPFYISDLIWLYMYVTCILCVLLHFLWFIICEKKIYYMYFNYYVTRKVE